MHSDAAHKTKRKQYACLHLQNINQFNRKTYNPYIKNPNFVSSFTQINLNCQAKEEKEATFLHR